MIDVQKCDSLHCFKYNMTYAAPDSQMVALIESSERCFQSIKMECLSAPYQVSNSVVLTLKYFNLESAVFLYLPMYEFEP